MMFEIAEVDAIERYIGMDLIRLRIVMGGQKYILDGVDLCSNLSEMVHYHINRHSPNAFAPNQSKFHYDVKIKFLMVSGNKWNHSRKIFYR